MSFPKRVDRFTQWAKDMVQGATVERPKLTRGKKPSTGSKGSQMNHKRRKSRRKRKKNAKAW